MRKNFGTLLLFDLYLGGSQRIDLLSLDKSAIFAVVSLLNQYKDFVADTIERFVLNYCRVQFVLSLQLNKQVRQK
jgi:hypothetical protein